MDKLCFFSASILLMLISIQWYRNKWLMLMSGYNTMPEEERKKIDIRPYAIAGSRSMASGSLLMCIYGINTLELSIAKEYILTALIISWMLCIWSIISILKLNFCK
ncbi:MAG: DUF3784 domain-containing protein [Lancefieldella parvula]|uniref:DUF3784 domain-containing protein n=1 Tax=Lancefieldella parvula TaxID=1382 RepID=A0A9E7DBC6_9ACTN|nr:MAG: DUF3784 domain-containing protein [Lancefieldella parvula]